MDTRKETLLLALRQWINQRPGLDAGNYDRAGYRSESRQIRLDRAHAIEILGAIALRPYVTADHILQAAASAFSGRLAITEDSALGEFRIDYCTGQYWPTEYRKAAAAVLARAYWDAFREADAAVLKEQGKLPRDGDGMRKYFRGEFGSAIQERWFD